MGYGFFVMGSKKIACRLEYTSPHLPEVFDRLTDSVKVRNVFDLSKFKMLKPGLLKMLTIVC